METTESWLKGETLFGEPGIFRDVFDPPLGKVVREYVWVGENEDHFSLWFGRGSPDFEYRQFGGTALLDSVENRKDAEALARLISKAIRNGQFNYLEFFPKGNRAEEFKPKQEKPKTIGQY